LNSLVWILQIAATKVLMFLILWVVELWVYNS